MCIFVLLPLWPSNDGSQSHFNTIFTFNFIDRFSPFTSSFAKLISSSLWLHYTFHFHHSFPHAYCFWSFLLFLSSFRVFMFLWWKLNFQFFFTEKTFPCDRKFSSLILCNLLEIFNSMFLVFFFFVLAKSWVSRYIFQLFPFLFFYGNIRNSAKHSTRENSWKFSNFFFFFLFKPSTFRCSIFFFSVKFN